MTAKRHINAEFDSELSSLKGQISAMGGLVNAQVGEAMAALVEKDAERARSVIAADRAVNQMERAIDEQCIRMLALRQPAASDLRFIAAALKMVTDLERIGDLAVNMAERVETMLEQPPLRATQDLPELCEKAQGRLREALDAFVSSDPGEAEALLPGDPALEAWTARLLDEIEVDMTRDSRAVRRGIATVFFVKHIERMADHTTNIAEMVVYHVRGEDVRHTQSS